MKRALVCGAGGFLGGHLVKRLKAEGYWVKGVDLKSPEFEVSAADIFQLADLRDKRDSNNALGYFGGESDEVYQLAADMGGAEFVFSGANDADILRNNALINLNVLEACKNAGVGKVFFASSACVYSESVPSDYGGGMERRTSCAEDTAYPANPDSDYGWEKLFSERLYQAYARNYGLKIRIGRFHNIYGPLGTWTGGREKAPAAICRKVAEAEDNSTVKIFGNGKQTRSFLYVDEAIEGVRRLMESTYAQPLNIGSAEMVSINTLVCMAAQIAGKKLGTTHIRGPLGVRGRNSDNTKIKEVLGWAPNYSLFAGLQKLYPWIEQQVEKANVCQ